VSGTGIGTIRPGNEDTFESLVSVGQVRCGLSPHARWSAGLPGRPAGVLLFRRVCGRDDTRLSGPDGVRGRGVADRIRTATAPTAPIEQEPGADWARDLRGTAMVSGGTTLSTGPLFDPVILPRFRREEVHGAQRLRWGGVLVMEGWLAGTDARDRADLWLFRYDVGHAY